jgi:aspartate dehydrogenase
MTRIGVIGYGGIARDLLAALREPIASGEVDLAGVLARPERLAPARERLGAVPVVASLAGLLEKKPKIVIEAAGHQAVADHGEAVVSAGTDFLVISTGALARPALLERRTAAASRHAARLLLPAGAVGGIDAIAAMRLAGLSAVSYRAVKPPEAWRGSPAERITDLDRLAARTVLYHGNAREAALRFPQNANVVATVALSGLGFEATRVELVADPDASGNRHEIEAEGATGRIAIALQGKPSAANPKTSALTAFSIARAVLNEAAAIVI